MKKKRDSQKPDSNRFLLTYTDLMNLLLILFIVLYSTSTINAKKAAAVSKSIREGISGKAEVTSSESTGKGSGVSENTGNEDYSEFFDKLMALIKQNGLENKVNINYNSNEVVITLRDNVLFRPGQYDIAQDAANLMEKIGGLLKQIQYGQIYVDGHTDSDSIHNSRVQDNLDLSSKRADNVERILLSCGLDPTKIVAAGHGEYLPVAPNTTAENKARNRRVVLTILRKSTYPPDNIVSADQVANAISDANKSAATVSGSTKHSKENAKSSPQENDTPGSTPSSGNSSNTQNTPGQASNNAGNNRGR